MQESIHKTLLKWLGNKCVVCGISDPEMLQIDHVYNNGFLDRDRFGSSLAMYTYYLNHPEEAKERLQILCANHNWKKRKEAQKIQAKITAKLEVAPDFYAPEEEILVFLSTCDADELRAIQIKMDIIREMALTRLETHRKLQQL